VFLPKLMQQAMKADAEAAIEAFGKNEQVKSVFWTLFVAMAGLVLTQVILLPFQSMPALLPSKDSPDRG
jgi:hypothetical protein